MILTRLRQALLLLLACCVSFIGFFQMFDVSYNGMPQRFILPMACTICLIAIFQVATMVRQPYATQTIFPCVLMLTSVGIMMIARLAAVNSFYAGSAINQLIWFAIALTISTILIIFLTDYRIFRRFTYIWMILGLALLLSPLIPGLGKTIGGARIWIGIGSHSLQPSEFAKLFLAIFFASYLFDHRDQLAVGGKKILGLRLPRIQDLGPILIVWVVSMLVLILQHDMGTSLLFFALFVSMLYVATGRGSWIIIGGIAFTAGAITAITIFPYAQNRINAWLNPFDPQLYASGKSQQLVSGIFGLGSGGLFGTGIGKGYPWLTPLANSDFIYASLGEEFGLTGIFAILTIYLVIIGAGILTAIKITDGFGKLLASGLVFTMAFQLFTVIGGITLVIPLTGLTLPFMAAGGSSLIANCIVATMLIILSHAANKPVSQEELSQTFQMEALAVLKEREEQRKEQQEEISKALQASQTATTIIDREELTNSADELSTDTAENSHSTIAVQAEHSTARSTKQEVAEQSKESQAPTEQYTINADADDKAFHGHYQQTLNDFARQNIATNKEEADE